MSTSTTKVWQPRAKITPPLRSFSLDPRKLLTAVENALSDGRNSRTVDAYMRAIRAFLDFDPRIKSLMMNDKFFLDGEQFKRYTVYLKNKGACIYPKLQHLLNALSVAFPRQFDKDTLRKLCGQHKPRSGHTKKRGITLPIGSLSQAERSFVAFIEKKYGYHRRDNYLRFMGHLHRFCPGIMTIDYRKRFLQSTFAPVLTAWLASVSNASSLQGFHLVSDALNAWLNTCNDWMKLAIRARAKALAPQTKWSTAGNKPRIAASAGKGGTLRPFKVLTDMRRPPLLNLMDTLAPTHRSPIQPSRPLRAIRETSRGLLDRDVLVLINTRIAKGIGSPDDRAEEIFALPSLMALTEFLDQGQLDTRTKGRVLGRIRWLRRRVYPHDDDHGSLYLSVMGRDYFRTKRPQRRDVSHIDYNDLTERLRAFLLEVECGLQAKIGGHSLRYVEWRDLLIVGLMLATGIRLKNAHGLKSHWVQLGPAPSLSIPASEHKNGRPFSRALPDWLVTSLRAYAPISATERCPMFRFGSLETRLRCPAAPSNAQSEKQACVSWANPCSPTITVGCIVFLSRIRMRSTKPRHTTSPVMLISRLSTHAIRAERSRDIWTMFCAPTGSEIGTRIPRNQGLIKRKGYRARPAINQARDRQGGRMEDRRFGVFPCSAMVQRPDPLSVLPCPDNPNTSSLWLSTRMMPGTKDRSLTA